MRYSDDHIRKVLEDEIARAGGVRRLAAEVGLSPAFISAVRSSQAPPGPTLASYLGYVEDGKRWVEKR
ncbi:MAG: hypothetical protein RLZ98_3461 [Pseudomonadota bacterium]|jgi:hypothetical protein